jgi:bacteriorhodopsin
MKNLREISDVLIVKFIVDSYVSSMYTWIVYDTGFVIMYGATIYLCLNIVFLAKDQLLEKMLVNSSIGDYHLPFILLTV